MNNLIKKQTYLPENIKELTKFVLIGREKLISVKAEIRAINKLELAADVREQKKEEATMLAGALLDAEAKLGDMIKKIDIKTEPSSGGRFGGSKKILPKGISHKQSHYFQTLADNKDIIEQVKAEAEDNDDLPTRTEVLKRVKERNRIDVPIRKITKPLEGEYDVIVIDPPWDYGTEYDSESRRIASPYQEIPTNQLELTKYVKPAKDCVIWLWTTHRFLPIAFQKLSEWGFDYKLTLAWNKEKLGMGSWLRCQVEFCLLGIKGKPVWNLTNERDFIQESRREHSRKPQAFYKMVLKLCVGRKADIFSREEHNGFNQFGNETKKF